jgi:hypothetical protein
MNGYILICMMSSLCCLLCLVCADRLSYNALVYLLQVGPFLLFDLFLDLSLLIICGP